MMKKIWERNKRLLTVLGFLFCLVAVAHTTILLQPTAEANTSSAANYSMYAMSQSAAQFLNNTQSPEFGGKLPKQLNLKMTDNAFYAGNGGALLGYQDEWEKDSSFTVSGTESGNTVTYYYNTLNSSINIDDGAKTFTNILTGTKFTWGGAATSTVQFSGYGYFGYALSEMGLDETAMAGETKSLRNILGIVMLALYSLATSVDTFFHLVFGMLRFANPFRLFLGNGSVIRQILGTAGDGLNGLVIGDGSINTAGFKLGTADGIKNAIIDGMGELVTLITNFYNLLYDFSMALILPIMLAFALFAWLVMNRGGRFFAIFKPFFIKVTFIVLGVPLLFAVYSAALDTVYDFTAPANSVSSRVVMSTFFDFEKWVYNSRLSMLGGYVEVTLDGSGTVSLSSRTIANSRYYLAYLNKVNYKKATGLDFEIGVSAPVTLSPSATINDANVQTVNDMHNYNTSMLNGEGGSLGNIGSGGALVATKDAEYLSAVVDLLQRYANGSIVSASSYQSYVTAGLLADAIGDGTDLQNNAEAKEVFAEYDMCRTSWLNFHPQKAASYKYQNGDGSITNAIQTIDMTETEVRQWAEDRFNKGSGKKCQQVLWSSGGLVAMVPDSKGVVQIGQSALSTDWGLSAMAMYNYLCSSFDETKITVYSAANTGSNQVQIGHYAVTTVGSGLMKWIYLIDAIVLLGCCTVIGYGYGLSLLIANFKSIFKIIPNVLTGMLGSLRGIASAAALTAALVVELIGTCLLYSIGTQIIFALYKAVEVPLQYLLTGDASSKALGTMLPVLFGVISIALIAMLTSKLLQWRIAICQATTEACTAFINKFVGTNISAPNLHDGMSMTDAASILVGAGMAAAGMAGMSGEDVREKTTDALGGLAGQDSKTASLTDGTGALLEDKDGEGKELTEEEKKEQALGVKKGNGTGETPGIEDKEGDGWDEDGKNASTTAANGVSGTGSETTENNVKTTKEAGEGGVAGTGKLTPDGDGSDGDESDMEGGTVNAQIDGEVEQNGENSIGAGELGYNEDDKAQDYIEQQRQDFENQLNAAAEQRQQANMATPEYQQMIAGQQEAASAKSITDTNGQTQDGLRVVNADTGEAYTQADKDAGVNFSIQNADGTDYVDSNGQTYVNMSADNIQMDDNGRVTAVTDNDGNTAAVTSADNPTKAIMDSNGQLQGDLTVVNSDTGQVYTQADKDSGANYTVLDSNGEIYVDSNGQSYENMSAKDVHIDGATGQVDMIRDNDGNKSVVMNNDLQASSIITSPTGEKMAGVNVISDATGMAYTEADRNAGNTFTVVDRGGNVVVDGSGQAMSGMSSSDVSIDMQTGMVNGVKDSQGGIYEVQSTSAVAQTYNATLTANDHSNTQATATVYGGGSNSQAVGNDVNTGSAPSVSTSSGTTYVVEPAVLTALGTGMVMSTVGSNVGGTTGDAMTTAGSMLQTQTVLNTVNNHNAAPSGTTPSGTAPSGSGMTNVYNDQHTESTTEQTVEQTLHQNVEQTTQNFGKGTSSMPTGSGPMNIDVTTRQGDVYSQYGDEVTMESGHGKNQSTPAGVVERVVSTGKPNLSTGESRGTSQTYYQEFRTDAPEVPVTGSTPDTHEDGQQTRKEPEDTPTTVINNIVNNNNRTVSKGLTGSRATKPLGGRGRGRSGFREEHIK